MLQIIWRKMWSKINWFMLLVMFSFISPSFSAVFWNLNKPELEDYTSSRSENFHRGLLFSLTAAQKHEICIDYFSAQLYLARELGGEKVENEMISEINDAELRTGSEKSQHALIVDKVGLTISAELILNKSDIFFKCVGRSINFDLRSPHQFGIYYISYAFRFGLFFDNFLESRYQHDPSMNIMSQMRYFSMSPEYVALQPDDLENQYLQTRRTMQALQNESPNYVELIRKRDNLSSLPKWKKFFLCASILSSPTYRIDRLEFSLDWANQIDDDSLRYQETNVKFKNQRSDHENLTADCMICKGFTNAEAKKKKSTVLYLTRSHDNKNSLYVLKEEAEGPFLSKYFRYIPLLKNEMEKPLNEGFLYHY